MSKPMSRGSYSLSAIPIELLQPIFQALPQGELFRICALSRTFHKEVARVLYRHVDLADSTLAQCTSWARQIVTRCDLAQLTLTLSLPGYILEDDSYGGLVPFLAVRLPKAMRAMPNLTSLALERHRHPILHNRTKGSFLNIKPFLGCSFRLKTFRSEIHWSDSNISPFLHEQSQIQDLEMGGRWNLTPPPGSTPASLLPRLSVVSADYRSRQNLSLFTIIASRPLTRLRICAFASLSTRAITDIIHTLAPAGTLTHLDLDDNCVFGPSTTIRENYFVEALVIIARGLPKLKFLRFSKRIALDPSPWDWLELPRALSAFKGLEMLMLDNTSIPTLQPDMSILQVRPSSAIPIELLQPIFQLLSQGELFRICALSHTFHEEVVRVLYRHVDLVDSALEQCSSWACQIITRCDLAQLTLALSLPVFLRWEKDDGGGVLVPFLAVRLPKAMRAMANLTSLTLEQHCYLILHNRTKGSFLDIKPFLGCSFRLKTFRSEINLPDSDILPFIHEQSQIQDLEMGGCWNLTPPLGSTPASFLPHLTVVSAGYRSRQNLSLFTIIASRPLTRLRICLYTYPFQDAIAGIIHTLAPAKATLTHLELDDNRIFGGHRTTTSENYFVEALVLIARSFPKLKFLHFSKRIALDQSPWDWLELSRALSAFEGLETLMLDARDDEGTGKGAREHSRGFAQRCMALCPTLRCLAITGHVPLQSDTVPQHMSFTRTPGSDSSILISSLKALDKSAWRDA
ncbi:hypothetical protein FIBSPDRAFT_1052010, partial [Athelia psychrophila]